MRLSASLLTTILLNMLLTWGCGQRSANSAGLTSSHANRRLQDLEVLCASIKENYPALETKRVQFGFDIDHACNNARISLAKLSIGNDLEFYRVLQTLILGLHDAHTAIAASVAGSESLLETGVRIHPLGGKAIVILNSSSEAKIGLGDELLSLDGKSPTHYQLPPVSLNRPDYADFVAIGRTMLFAPPDRPDSDKVLAKFRSQSSGGNEYFVTLPYKKTSMDQLDPTHLEFDVTGKTGIWRVGSFGGSDHVKTALMTDLSKLKAKLGSLRSLVIDFRNNGGGTTNFGFAVLRILLGAKQFEKLAAHVQFRCSEAVKLAMQDNLPPEFYGKGCDHQSSGDLGQLVDLPLFDADPDFEQFGDIRFSTLALKVLVGPGSYSTTESVSKFLQMTKRATFVGMPTGGGSMFPMVDVELPNSKWHAGISAMNFFYPSDNGSFDSLEGIGVVPDVSCTPTIGDLTGHGDSCLELAKRLR